MQNLQNTFRDRTKWINTRSSTIFPVYINENNNQFLVFQNYWKWKNKIKDIRLILTLRNENSTIISKIKYRIKEHNEISIKKIFKIKIKFIGQLECELESTENLKFPYPALMFFYQNSGGYESAVHSAGRHLNPSENISSKFYESNFYSQMNKDFSPLIHIFSGKEITKKSKEINIEFLDNNNKIIFKKKIKNLFKKPFSSKLIFLKKYLSKEEMIKIFNKVFFIKIKFDISNIFGRLIVGNYDKKNDALFMSHTFRVHSEKKLNIIKPRKNFVSTAYLPVMNLEPLKLTARSYPTNAVCRSKFDNYRLSEKNKIKIDSGYIKTSGEKSNIFEIIQNKSYFNILEFKDKVPDRLNFEFNYYLENSRHPTDIADGIKTCYQPRKSSHWGHGVSKKNYVNYILIANYSNSKKENKNEQVEISIFSEKKKIKKKLLIKKSTYYVVKLYNLQKTLKSNYFSWTLHSGKSNLNIYWVSFNNKGSICGDHAF
jgi:hypothetical protein